MSHLQSLPKWARFCVFPVWEVNFVPRRCHLRCLRLSTPPRHRHWFTQYQRQYLLLSSRPFSQFGRQRSQPSVVEEARADAVVREWTRVEVAASAALIVWLPHPQLLLSTVERMPATVVRLPSRHINHLLTPLSRRQHLRFPRNSSPLLRQTVVVVLSKP